MQIRKTSFYHKEEKGLLTGNLSALKMMDHLLKQVWKKRTEVYEKKNCKECFLVLGEIMSESGKALELKRKSRY